MKGDSQFNGNIGESRTKAILSDRFVVVEKSIDVEGGDVYVQLRSQNSSSSLGRVQAKFFQDKPNIYIPTKYVLDENQSPLEDYFLFIHTGNEDLSCFFFFTAKDVKRIFSYNRVKDAFYFDLGKQTISKYEAYKSRPIVQILDVIENKLEKLDLIQASNRINIEVSNAKLEEVFGKRFNRELLGSSEYLQNMTKFSEQDIEILEKLSGLIFYNYNEPFIPINVSIGLEMNGIDNYLEFAEEISLINYRGTVSQKPFISGSSKSVKNKLMFSEGRLLDLEVKSKDEVIYSFALIDGNNWYLRERSDKCEPVRLVNCVYTTAWNFEFDQKPVEVIDTSRFNYIIYEFISPEELQRMQELGVVNLHHFQKEIDLGSSLVNGAFNIDYDEPNNYLSEIRSPFFTTFGKFLFNTELKKNFNERFVSLVKGHVEHFSRWYGH